MRRNPIRDSHRGCCTFDWRSWLVWKCKWMVRWSSTHLCTVCRDVFGPCFLFQFRKSPRYLFQCSYHTTPRIWGWKDTLFHARSWIVWGCSSLQGLAFTLFLYIEGFKAINSYFVLFLKYCILLIENADFVRSFEGGTWTLNQCLTSACRGLCNWNHTILIHSSSPATYHHWLSFTAGHVAFLWTSSTQPTLHWCLAWRAIFHCVIYREFSGMSFLNELPLLMKLFLKVSSSSFEESNCYPEFFTIYLSPFIFHYFHTFFPLKSHFVVQMDQSSTLSHLLYSTS